MAIPKEGHQFSGLLKSREGNILRARQLRPEWVPIKGYRMEVDIGIAALRQVAAAPIKVPDRKLCKSYLSKVLKVAGEFEKRANPFCMFQTSPEKKH